jgi:hypothetical protein
MFYPENIPAFASVYLDGASAQDPRASPLYADNLRGLPPVLLQVGSTELLLEDARRMHERLLAAGGASRLSIYEDVVHGWQLLTPLIPEACAAVREVADFLRVHRVGAGTVERPLNGPVGLTCRWEGVHRGTGAAFRSFMSRHTSLDIPALRSQVRFVFGDTLASARMTFFRQQRPMPVEAPPAEDKRVPWTEEDASLEEEQRQAERRLARLIRGERE